MEESVTSTVSPDAELSQEEIERLQEEIQEQKRERHAVLLGHYYAPPEVQDVCDFVGDSLGLSRQAADTQAQMIVFNGVHFMAETASSLAPGRKVILPDLSAGCSLADSITAHDIEQWKAQYPRGVVIAYVNTTAAVKALTDCCCTSATAVQVVQHYAGAERILFLPDWNLGHYVQAVTGIKMDIWRGSCHVHDAFTASRILMRMAQEPGAEVLVHPESSGAVVPEIRNSPRVTIASTTGMIKHLKASRAKKFLIVTEKGVLHNMHQAAPEKELMLIGNDANCRYMQLPTLPKVREALRSGGPEVKVPEVLAQRAYGPIKRMLEIG